MRTFGLGGDSEVALEDGALDPKILLGPRRLVPLALAGMAHGEAVTAELERQLRSAQSRPHGRPLRGPHRRAGAAGRRADRRRKPSSTTAITGVPQPLDRLLDLDRAERHAEPAGVARAGACRRLHAVRRRPCAGQAGQLGRGRGPARRRAVRPQARRPRPADRRRRPRRSSERVLAALTRLSAEVILETAFAEDGLDGAATVAHALVQRAVDAHQGIARLRVALDRPVIGLGASAPLHYAGPAAAGRQPLRRAGGYRRRQRAGRRRRPGAGVAPKRWSASPRKGCSASRRARRVQRFHRRGGSARRGRSAMCAPRLPSARWPPAPIPPRSRSSATSAPRRSRASACSSRRVSLRWRPGGRALRCDPILAAKSLFPLTGSPFDELRARHLSPTPWGRGTAAVGFAPFLARHEMGERCRA